MTTAGSSKGRTLGSCPSNAGSTPAPATIWQRFANLLGIEERHAEDALHSERVAKHVVSRRSFLGAAGALAGAAVFAFPTPAQDELAELVKPKRSGSTLTTFDALLKERYAQAGPQMIFMNPNDYSALMKTLPVAEKAEAGRAIITSPYVPIGSAFEFNPNRGALTRA